MAGNAGGRSSRTAVKRKKEHIALFSRGLMDINFFIIVITLLVIGIIMMFSASYAKALSESNGASGMTYAIKQIEMGAIGIAAMFFFSFFDYRHFANPKLAISFFVLCVILLIAVLVVGITEGGAKRWIYIGTNFQPSELMKLAVIILFSYLIVQNYDKMERFSIGIVPFAVLLAIVDGLLMLEPHLSCTLLISTVGAVLMFVGGVRWKHIGILAAIGGGALALFKRRRGALKPRP